MSKDLLTEDGGDQDGGQHFKNRENPFMPLFGTQKKVKSAPLKSS